MAVFSALMASLTQLTFGLRMEWQAIAISLAAASLAFTMLLAAFALIQITLSNWFDSFDEEAQKAHKDRLEKKN